MIRLARALAPITATVALTLLVIWLPSGCSDDDPVSDQCDKQCKVDDTHPCKAQEDACLQACKQIGGEAKNRGHQGEACATCLVELVTYSGWRCKSGTERCTFGSGTEKCEAFAGCAAGGNGEQCFGVNTQVQLSDPKCLSVCFEPDAGMPSGF